MTEIGRQSGSESDDNLPFIPINESIGDAEQVYELSDPDSSIVRVLTSHGASEPLNADERQTGIEYCTQYAQELEELDEQYGIKTPRLQYVIGALKDAPDEVALYAQVDRVQGDNLATALDKHEVPDEVYDGHLAGQVK